MTRALVWRLSPPADAGENRAGVRFQARLPTPARRFRFWSTISCIAHPATRRMRSSNSRGLGDVVSNDGLRQRMDSLHLPVPKDHIDDAYFASLADRVLHAKTTLYLGLVHHAEATRTTAHHPMLGPDRSRTRAPAAWPWRRHRR